MRLLPRVSPAVVAAAMSLLQPSLVLVDTLLESGIGEPLNFRDLVLSIYPDELEEDIGRFLSLWDQGVFQRYVRGAGVDRGLLRVYVGATRTFS